MTEHPHNKPAAGAVKILKVFLKALLWIIGIPVSLVIIAIIALQFEGVQLYVTNKATAYLSKKINSKVTLRRLNLSFPKMIALEDIYVEDQKKDTLLYAHSLKVDLDLPGLLSNRVDVNAIQLENVTGHISRSNADFNFDFIVNAFAGKSKEPTVADSTSAAWEISLRSLELKNIYFTFHDQQSGTNADLRLGKLDVALKAFDLEHKKIHVRSIDLADTYLAIRLSPVAKTKDEDTAPFDYDLSVSELNLSSIRALYCNAGNGQSLDVALGSFSLAVNKVDLPHQNIDINSLGLSGSRIVFANNKVTAADAKPLIAATQTATASNWIVQLKNLALDNNSLVLDDNLQPHQKKGIDFSHLAAEHISLGARNLYLSEKKISAAITQISFREKSGFGLKHFSGQLEYDDQHMQLSALEINTSASRIGGDYGIRYRSLQNLKDSIKTLGLNLAFKNTSIATGDILYFVPDLFNDSLFNGDPHTSLKLDGRISGSLDQLQLEGLQLSSLHNTVLNLDGSVQHVLDPKAMYLRLNDVRIAGSEKDLSTLLAKKMIPESIRIPERFELKGEFSGYLKNFNARLRGNTSFGDIMASVKMNPKAGNVEQSYDASVSLNAFDPGKLLKQSDLLGPVTMTAAVKGSGFSMNRLDAGLNIFVQSAEFKHYAYKDLLVQGKLSEQAFTGTITINDPNLAFNYQGSLSFDPAKPNYVFTLDLKGADLKALNLSNEDLRLSALIQSDIHDRSDKNFTGRASIKNALIIRDNKKYPLDSLVFISEVNEGVSKISLRSDIMSADFTGDITLNQLPAALKKHVNHYFNLQEMKGEALNAQKFDFEIKMSDPSLLTRNLIPELENLSPFTFKGGFDSEARKLSANGSIPQVIYSGIKIDSLKLDVSSDQEKLNYSLSVAEISNPTLKFENLGLGGELKNSSLSFQFNTNKDDSTKTIAIGGLVSEKNKVYTLKINQDLFLNAEKWTVDPANYLEFGQKNLIANQLIISRDNTALSLNSTNKGPEAPLEVKFVNFDLATFSRLIENNNDLASGKMNGNVIFEKHNGASGFRSDLLISDLKFKNVPVGTIKLKADNIENAQKYDLDLSVEGNGNDIVINGSYLAADKNNNLDFLLDVRNLNLATVEPFTFGQVTRMSGGVNGKLKIKGSAAEPDVTGNLNFRESAFRPRIIDSYLTVHEGKMTFASKKLYMNNVLIYDSLNNKASVDGFVNIGDLKNMSFDMQLKTVNFLALNTKREDNPLYFGRVFLDSDMRLKGNIDSPVIDLKAKLNKGSFITYVKPESEVGKNDSKGIVEFADSLYHPGIMTRTNDTLKLSSELKGITLNASINFDKAVELKMLVDQDSGDSLYILGNGKLDFTLDKSGKTTLTGKYSINEGGYHLAISDVVKRNFKIERGSSVTWSGDVLEPYVDLKAIYVIKTSPIDLVQDELSGMTELERNKYRNLLTFYVYLKMTGFISQPDISFDIQLAPDDRGALNGSINSKLGQLREDETELNKQVFALLTLRRFIGENPLDNGNDGGGLSSASRSSASKVLTQQLSSLSDKYINFVDLDLGVNSFEDYSSGVEEGRTQLQVGVSKQLLNDKVTVRVGGNVELEGERARQNNANDVAGNISIDYKLTEDGRYKLKAFRENQYENPIEGELTKTGAGIIYVRNFKKFSELLKKPVKRKSPITIDDEKNTKDKKDPKEEN